ncbi:MAG TPA: zf-HC2 domain-containing protein [Pyrinomonadaceae bacterium]|nr:zf-HC2 domain-containing protein [Pyrinomonadaceae bacterium]
MRTLNCKRTARLISLYVAGDLVGAPEREVAAHLAACETCRRLADEFSESGRLLTQASAPPEFGAEFYSGIRQAVLGEIGRERMPSKPSLFRPRWLYATAFAAIVIASGVVLLHFAGAGRETPPDLVRAPQTTGQPTSPSSDGQSPRKKHELPGTRSAQSSNVLALARPHGSFRRFEGMRTPFASVTAQAARDSGTQIELPMQSSTRVGTNAAGSVATVGGPSSASSGRASASQVSRMEIQTADPNIRIIWLSPRESREPEPTNHDQDQRENGNRK